MKLEDTQDTFKERVTKYAFTNPRRSLKLYMEPIPREVVILWSRADWIESKLLPEGRSDWRVPSQFMSFWPWEDRKLTEGEYDFLIRITRESKTNGRIIRKETFLKLAGAEFKDVHPEREFWRAKEFGIIEKVPGTNGCWRVTKHSNLLVAGR